MVYNKKKLYRFIGSKIKNLREEYGGKGINQEMLAKEIGTQPNTISRWENATYKPKVTDLEKLAIFFWHSNFSLFPKFT